MLLSAILIAFEGCKEKKKTDEETYREILTSRTLGLAYLEENKLNEAEVEFLKLTTLAPDESMGFANLGLVYLRMGRHEDAIEQLKKAIEIAPENPEVRLILAKVYEVSGQMDNSLQELLNIIKSAPEHIKSLYSLAEFYGKQSDSESLRRREEYLQKVVDLVPENIVPTLNLIEVLIRNDKLDAALEHLERIRQLFPVFPEEADNFYDNAIKSLRAGDGESALTAVRIFHNFLKVSSPYQAGILELKGPGGELIGFPVITVGNAMSTYIQEGESILEAIRFNDVTATVGLVINEDKDHDITTGRSVIIALFDFDRDGDQDLYAGENNSNSSVQRQNLFQNEMGSYSNIAVGSGIEHSARESASAIADYDNDGYLDLFIITDEGYILYKNDGEGNFEDITAGSGLEDITGGNVAEFVDLDHDGDLDLFIGRRGRNLVFRNNADGTFTETGAAMNLAGEEVETIDAAFGDFDDDGDIDLIVINENAPSRHYSNMREGNFQVVNSGLGSDALVKAVTTGDYNNDGYLDVFLLGKDNSGHVLLSNKRDGTFERDGQSENINLYTKGIEPEDAAFLDFDNDGALDLVVAGSKGNNEGRSLVLIHNDGWAKFEDESGLLPGELPDISQIEIADFNEDGDLDLYLACKDGSIRLLRNDGGNANHYLKIQLVGLRAGSSKNNHYGIGSKVEVRSGDLYQMKVVTDPNVHFGLGPRAQADVVRILWTNGVPQNIFTPRSDQDLIEEQELKGSCPFLYTWDGEKYVFVKDMMWRSALGMPLGIMGGETAYAFADASREYLKIPGRIMKEKDGQYDLRITAELWETIYFDQLQLIAVDHPADQTIQVDEKFAGPPFPDKHIYTIKEEILPLRARDGENKDLLPFLSEKDDRYVTGFKKEKYQGVTEMHELILTLEDNTDDAGLHLFMKGWIFPTDASINVAIAQSSDMMSIQPYLQVLDENCEWVTVIDNIGFPMGKDKTVVVDLEDRFLSEQRKVRILTNMEIYWDHIYFGYQVEDPDVQSFPLKLSSANLRYRGFSALFRKGGRYGPHWFDYNRIETTGQKWRDLTGNYTRFGDVMELLQESDNQYIIMNAGDEVSVMFEAGHLPKTPEGWVRDFLLYSVGWVKDGDLNTATGQTVAPLPYHGMPSYPYGDNDAYPEDQELRDYLQEYNTRTITTDSFRHALSEQKN